MFDVNVAAVLIICLLILVSLGVHIAIALGMTSALVAYLTFGSLETTQNLLASTAYEALRDYVFAVIPLFMLMGEFISKCGAVTDVYRGINRGLRKIPGRLAVATILGNAVFSFVTGVSIASAAAFSRIAYPEMMRFGYHRGFALGSVAGSSCLGMLIPPSVLMIVWGILTEQSIGRIFLAGVIPGLLLVSMFVVYVLVMVVINPRMVGRDKAGERLNVGEQLSGTDIVVKDIDDLDEVESKDVWTSAIGIIIVVAAVLGGIWLGVFTPTEAAGAGAFIALILGIVKGLRAHDIYDAILSVGRTSAPILLLLLTAQLYSRSLAITGVTNAIQDVFLGTGLGPAAIIGMMVLIWFLLGMIIDSISIMLLTVSIFHPIIVQLGYDPIAFSIVGILAIEAGLLTPPFGLLVYTVKAAIAGIDDDMTIGRIFKFSAPYWILMLICMVAIVWWPSIATWLPDSVM